MICPLLNILKIKLARRDFYFYKKHFQLPVVNENGKTTSVDMHFIHTVLLTLVVC